VRPIGGREDTPLRREANGSTTRAAGPLNTHMYTTRCWPFKYPHVQIHAAGPLNGGDGSGGGSDGPVCLSCMIKGPVCRM